MKTSYPLHPDFKKIPTFNFNFHPWMMGFLNAVCKLMRLLDRMRTPGVERDVVQVRGADGAVFDVVMLVPAALRKPAPVVLYFHGGAFALGYTPAQLRVCERYALESQCVVAYVDYRLAPRYPFPYGFNDCYASLEWILAGAAKLGIDSSRIAVMGDSAGGAFAAGVTQKALDKDIRISAQLLIYPVLDSDCKTKSATEFVDVPLWNAISNRRMWQMYLKNSSGAAPAYAAPGQRESLSGLPQTYIETAEFDPLRDEGLAYAKALQEQGITVELLETKGTIHGFDTAPKNTEAVAAYRRRVTYLKTVFARAG